MSEEERDTNNTTNTTEEKYKNSRQNRRHFRSPSRRRVSSIEKTENEQLNINPEEIDEILINWFESKQRSRELAEKERRYKQLIQRIMNLTNSDVIKGKDLQVTRQVQKRRFLLKENMPSDIYDKYSTTREISMLYLREKK
jgi:hypothetical protein